MMISITIFLHSCIELTNIEKIICGRRGIITSSNGVGSLSDITSDDVSYLTIHPKPDSTIPWCRIQHPSDTQLYVSTSDQPTLQVYGRMYKEDITGHGENPKIKAQVGYGDTLEPKNYTWSDASFNKSEGNNIGDRAMAVSSPMRHKRIRLAARAIGRGRYALLRVAYLLGGTSPSQQIRHAARTRYIE